jgi:2-octaprenyl-6-methoxyphenol hydroxylase
MAGTAAEVIVVGGGPTGLTAAVALAMAHVETLLIAGRAGATDNRTTALLASSVTALDTLRVWPRCRPHAAPLKTMRLVDDTARLLRAPEVCFAADEIGLDAFGYNIENRHLVAALRACAQELSTLIVVEDDAVAVTLDDEKTAVRLADGVTVPARLVIGAEGRRSPTRAAAAIECDGRRYPQTALTCNFVHTRPHHDTSTEFHTEHGPFTLVPLPGRRSSLVFVADASEAPRLAAVSDADISAEVERRSHSILGKVTVEPGRGVFPLAVETARAFAGPRAALVGEAAHVMPPIGAQGLNLGLRDAATIAELVAAARRAGKDVGGEDVTGAYDSLRRADVHSRTLAVDLLNRSLLSDFLPFQGARGLGLFMLEQIGPLRRALMREGIAPAVAQPRLMRGEAL